MITINLLPVNSKGPRRVTVGVFGMLGLICLTYLSLVILEGHLNTKIRETEFLLKDSGVQDCLSVLEKDSDLAGESRRLQKELQEMNQQIALLEEARWNLSGILTEMVTCLPEELWLTRIEHQTEGKILVQGQSLTYDPILIWLESLTHLVGVSNVQPVYLKGEGVNQFTVRIEVGDKG